MPTLFTVPPEAERGRADKTLATHFPEHSRSAFHRAFDAGLVKLGGAVIPPKRQVGPGDEIEFELPETKPTELRAVEMGLEVLFEDKHLLAVNKRPGMIVHPGAGTGENTLVHALLAHCRGQLSGIGGVERPGIVHRLDRETSGLILVAKNDAAHRGLAAAFASRDVVKEYIALVSGVPRLLSGHIDKAIARHPRHRHRMTTVPTGGRESRTDWKVLRSWAPRASLLRCRIHTGRTHQIRVHLASLGHALLGDLIYGFRPSRVPFPVPRVMLHAEHLAIVHPVTKRLLDLHAPVPADFELVEKQLAGLPGE